MAGLRISEIVGLYQFGSKCCDVIIREGWVRDKDGNRRRRDFCSKCGKKLRRQIDSYRSRKFGFIIEPLTKDRVNLVSRQIFIKAGKGKKDRIVPAPKKLPVSYYDLLPIKIGERALQKAFQELLKRAKITREDISFHSLRSGFATRCLEAGMPLNQVQLLLGHANISTTSVYVRANPKDALISYENLF